MSWIELPQEIQLQIVDYLNRDDCKSLRVTNKTNATLVAPSLYHTIHLTPNSRSFDRARSIAQSPSLSQHVKSVVYHVGILEDVHNGFETFRANIVWLHKPIGSTEDIMKDILWKYHCFLEETDAQHDFRIRDEFEELQTVCTNLDDLESITTILDEDDPFNPPQDFIGHRTGVQCVCSADGPHFSNLFKAAAGISLTSINAWSLSWRCLPRIIESGLDAVEMSNMNQLALGLFNSEFLELEDEDQTLALEALDHFLTTTSNSREYSLEIDFDEIPFEAYMPPLQNISRILFKHNWPGLVKLKLHGIAATEDAIVRFLSAHATSLKFLHIDDIEIANDTYQNVDGDWTSVSGSILALFRRINETLQLDTALISGSFTNRHDESWYVNLEVGGDHCLRRDIEMWLSHKAPSPFPENLLYHRPKDVAETETVISNDDLNTDDLLKSTPAMEYSDDSWTWELDILS